MDLKIGVLASKVCVLSSACTTSSNWNYFPFELFFNTREIFTAWIPYSEGHQFKKIISENSETSLVCSAQQWYPLVAYMAFLHV